MPNSISDEFINSYIDNELSQDEQQWLLSQMSTDVDLANRVHQLQTCKNTLKMAFDNKIVAKSKPLTRFYQRPAILASAASFMLLLAGVLIGLSLSTTPPVATSNDLLSIAENSDIIQPDKNKTWKVMMHVSTGNEARLKMVLNETLRLLDKYKNSKKKVEVQILANAQGLNLFRKDKSKFADLIETMQKDYANLNFSACALAIENAEEAELEDAIHLLPNVTIVPSAFGEIVKKQQEGWSYIQI